MTIKKAMVIGSGQMGSGIAQVLAQSDIEVILNDIRQEFVEKGFAKIKKQVERLVEKEKITASDKDTILGNISLSTDYQDAKDVDIVIEAATENKKIKLEIFRQLDEITKPEAILASNTSSLSITSIAAVTQRPEQVVGMHFFNPVPVMKLVEIVSGLRTSDETRKVIADLAETMKKVSIDVKDSPAFVVNRILMSMIGEAMFTVYEGIATVEEVDEAMRLGANMPMGPLQLADFVGLDVCLAVFEVIYQGFGDSKYRICPLLRQYVEAGWLGKKTGRGFYNYE
ncbi:3-hydroxybutyryl-CoA dehydrogenase [Enterococcus canis]|uniref:3-hydroxybutyryl-CoA dehydrogenase n=1 Tax=Enterococcus canis TaxID=214095 RepID=A0A1L8RHX5_9ENTE|nr:3-hydroxybutyryl-CoA dehydrogenase [Enterococcus canis]OJG19324.1 3-hydroxybutyryl-CoA dehydrogenase [Enterococcus canis]